MTVQQHPAPTQAPLPSPGRTRPLTWIGGAAALAGLLIALAGGTLLAVFGTDGTLTSGRHAVRTDTAALVSESAHIDGVTGAVDFTGDLTVHIRTDPGVFVGVARSADVERYLGAAEYDEVTDVEGDPFRLPSRRRAGTATAASPPGAQDFWVDRGASALHWKLRDGDYRLVMMNEDGSRGVRTQGRFGVEVPVLPGLGWGVLGAGLLLLIGGAATAIASGTGRRRW